MGERIKGLFLRLIVWGLFIFIIIFIALFIYFPDYYRLKKLREENERLRLKIDSLKKEIANLREDMEKLEEDPFIWEKLARQNLGVVKKGEILVDIVTKQE
ncbi:MAG: septum formation initiator family protein [Candidatus Omnitrophica bacterium]|nr:septum formation initiator family protein [Candidatus Omnitrophota bacterium]MCM8826004.1 septum formation initiator family protein [Candidatus Omnitrophota bacterium]